MFLFFIFYCTSCILSAQSTSSNSTRKLIWILLCAEAVVINKVHDVHNRFRDPAFATAVCVFLFSATELTIMLFNIRKYQMFLIPTRRTPGCVYLSQYICGFWSEKSVRAYRVLIKTLLILFMEIPIETISRKLSHAMIITGMHNFNWMELGVWLKESVKRCSLSWL